MSLLFTYTVSMLRLQMQQRRCFMEAALEKEVWLRITVTCYKVLGDHGRTAITMYSITAGFFSKYQLVVGCLSTCSKQQASFVPSLQCCHHSVDNLRLSQTMLSFGHFHLIIYLLCSVIMQAHNNSRAGNDPLQ